ncbi:alkyl hydroperoxide reductase thiol specific antioxidant mal allergen [Colletotrichum chrysophilum]|uniref:Alkyl hydroperoxide reductase thiol specific antioxidant mal allergen n=1 Tax=Colletotrichum chrysophilum TaxID=1836956 RepID=A0AAD9AFQ8_9PEZI|nr:alkyl hydroperoxide reductase thiol specific antioxidant mal allergen [Colletotrichum chrysophilum]
MLREEVNVPSLQPPHQTPLHVALRKDLNKITKQLIEAGADVNALDENGVQPLHIACDNGNTELIKLLLDKRATTRGPDQDGWCLLHYASYYDIDADLLERLIEVDRNNLNHKESFEGWTPINRAAWFGRQNVVDALLKARVNLGIADKNGWTPMMTAIEEEHFKIFDKMVDHLADIGPNDADISKGVIDQRDDEGMTVLMTLCDADPSPTTEASLRNFLHKLQPSTDITDNIDQTALNHVMALAKRSNSPYAWKMALEMIKWWPEQDILRRSNEAAFDDIFDNIEDSGKLLQTLANRLRENFALRDKLLCRLAMRTESHPAAIEILSKLELHQRIEALGYKEKWTLVDWAIYHRMPRVLLNCPAANDLTPDHGTYGTKIINQLRELHSHSDSYEKRNTDRKDELTPRKVLDEMEDILNSLPQMRSEQQPKTRWKVLQPSDEMGRCLADYKAAVVRFRDKELEALRFRKVSNIVYGDSSIEVITISQIQESVWKEGTATEFAKENTPDTESSFTWVHLPATNVSQRQPTTFVKTS